MAVLVTGNEIVLSGTVGDLYWDDSFDHTEVILALAQVGRGQDVTIRLNSGGGIATEGAAIHAALSAHTGRKTIIVEGIAASAASVIAMAGDEIVMAMGSIMMIHDPSGFTFGTVAEHQLQIKALSALSAAMAGIYADRSGRTPDGARADMRDELWMSPEEAVEAGYADRVLTRGASAASGTTIKIDADDGHDGMCPEPTAFDFRLYQHPPERLVALADRRAWTNRARPTAASPAVPPRLKEKPMANAPAGNEPVIPENPTAALAAVVDGAKPTATASTVSRADASEIVTLCVAGGVPAMAASLLAEGATVAQAKERIGAAGEVKNLVALARRKDPTLPADLDATMLAEGKTVEQARAALFDKLVASEEQTSISSHPPAAQGNAGPTASATSMQRELKRAGLTKGA
ncbi:head maturation protease, ClpP-related [Methylobacterium sp. Leaf88]|uniref:head maturation protease, ClpP-related n=1 Tax=Methylobacterium sp. Leaf88 TaxID=1736244 RepID=UPI0006FC998C|nr:head maturation protease, ClpP-related [Methylobacterium sp. Leaf88]KQO76434.1 peptidase S14 [Methylobacterium sp. Leaf88]